MKPTETSFLAVFPETSTAFSPPSSLTFNYQFLVASCYFQGQTHHHQHALIEINDKEISQWLGHLSFSVNFFPY